MRQVRGRLRRAASLAGAVLLVQGVLWSPRAACAAPDGADADATSGWDLVVLVDSDSSEYTSRAGKYGDALWTVLRDGKLAILAPRSLSGTKVSEEEREGLRCTISVREQTVLGKNISSWHLRLELRERVRVVRDGRECVAVTSAISRDGAAPANQFAPLRVTAQLQELARDFVTQLPEGSPLGRPPLQPAADSDEGEGQPEDAAEADGPEPEPETPIPPGWRRTRFGPVPPQRTYSHSFRIDQIYKGRKRELWDRVGGAPRQIGDALSVSFLDAVVMSTKPDALRRFSLGAAASPSVGASFDPVVRVGHGDEFMPAEISLVFFATSLSGGLMSPSRTAPRAPAQVLYIVDGKRIRISTKDARSHYFAGDPPRGTGVEEQLSFVVDMRTFLKIVAGTNVRIEVGKVRVRLAPTHIQLYRDFASKLLWHPGDTGGGAAVGSG